MRLAASSFVLFLAASVPVAASGGFWCDVDDEFIALATRGGLAHGIPGGPFSFEAGLTVKLPDVPAGFREVDLGDALVQTWIAGPDLRLQMYRERQGEPFATIELILTTVRSEVEHEEWMYHGTYFLTVTELMPGDDEATIVEARGDVSCGTD